VAKVYQTDGEKVSQSRAEKSHQILCLGEKEIPRQPSQSYSIVELVNGQMLKVRNDPVKRSDTR